MRMDWYRAIGLAMIGSVIGWSMWTVEAADEAQTGAPADAEVTAGYPDALVEMNPKVLEALAPFGFSDATTLVIIQPGDKLTVMVPDRSTGSKFIYDEKYNVVLPEADNPDGVSPKLYQDLFVYRSSSPGWVTVCQKVGGSKVCWQEQQ